MKHVIPAALLLSMIAAPVLAQTAPPPHRAPRTPVSREVLTERKAPPREITGQALILDGERLKIDNYDLRLFGIVPPQLSASFGPQARAALDAVIAGQSVACRIRDRDHDGRLLANCRAANGLDPALELLKHGLAVAARGSIADTEYADPYVIAEQSAQNQKIGLWSMTAVSASPSISAVTETPKAEQPKPVEAKPVEIKPVEAKVDVKPADTQIKDVQPKTASAVMVPVKPASSVSANDVARTSQESTGFFARFQILIAGFLMLATAVGVIGAVTVSRRTEKRDEMKALAAALRGELLAARAVCLTRIKTVTTEEEDRAAAWPRIRSTLYQAYVGRLGWLGAELARQIASIYGLCSDYASYYANTGEAGTAGATPKRQALQSLVAHIDEVLPRLASIEQSGQRNTPNVYHPIAPANAPEINAAVPADAAVTSTAVAPENESKLWNVVRNLRERLVEPPAVVATEEPTGDYTASIEDDIEHLSFGTDDHDVTTPFKKLGGQ